MGGGIEAVVFDLDDTLFDCTGSLVDTSRRRAAEALVAAGLKMSVEDAYRLQRRLADEHGPYFMVFDEIGRRYDLSNSAIDAAYHAYNSDEVGIIRPFPDALSTIAELKSMGLRLTLLTVGVYQRQAKKIDLLGLRPHFDEVFINDIERGVFMSDYMRHLLTKYGLSPADVMVVGDRPHAELRSANELGMVSIQMMHGRFRDAEPRDEYEIPRYKINRLSQLPTIAALLNAGKPREDLRVVAIGGGTGLPNVLQGLKAYSNNLTAIVAVTDSGRSSGRLRTELGMLPPGDTRNCLVALSETGKRERELYELFQYRFNQGSLEGMSLGNLIIAALTDMTGGFDQAIKRLSDLLNIRGKVLPSTVTDTHICAELMDGTIVSEEFNVRTPGKPPIKRVFLRDESPAVLPEVIQEIRTADIIIIGPGSLYTSVIPNVLVPEIRRAIGESKGRTYYVCNIVTQPGQTDRFNAADHVRALTEYLDPEDLDFIVVNTTQPPAAILKRYEDEGASIVQVTDDLYSIGPKVVAADVAEETDTSRVLWQKQNLIRHDPDKLADAICRAYCGLAAFKE